MGENYIKHNPVIIPEDPPKKKWKVTMKFPGRQPEVFETEAASRDDLEAAISFWRENGVEIIAYHPQRDSY